MADLLSICGVFLVWLKLVKSEADKHSGVFVSSFHPLGRGTVGGVERLVELRSRLRMHTNSVSRSTTMTFVFRNVA